ncbi:MAG: hypothetical protein U5R48_10075 [Gammaproteobacteria bacterium]|nr:hypothetical protein [Gammaproteobacteria bacterium]
MVRRDFNEGFDDATHWRLSARTALPFDLGDGWVSVSRATKNPTFGERFGFTPDSFLGNPDLTPEQGRRESKPGWTRSFADDRLHAELLWYRTRLEDEIDGFAFESRHRRLHRPQPGQRQPPRGHRGQCSGCS